MDLIPKNRYGSHLLFILLWFPFHCLAQSTNASGQEFVNELSAQMAIESQLQQIPADIRAQFEQNPLQLPEAKNKRMLEFFDDAYASQKLLRDFKQSILPKMTDERRKEISRQLKKPSIQAAMDAKKEYYSLQGQRKKIVTMYEMEQQPPPAQRTHLITSLTDTIAAKDSEIESSIIILRSIIRALSQLSEQRNFTEPQVNAIVNNFRTQMTSQANEQINNQYMITYYNVDLNTLQDFVTFSQSDTGQWLDEAISTSMQTAYQNAANRFLEMVTTNQ